MPKSSFQERLRTQNLPLIRNGIIFIQFFFQSNYLKEILNTIILATKNVFMNK